MLKLSLIIPVYNEERHIRRCLDAVEAQTVMPDEVIVVDNNCSDRTIEIAKGYDFVRIVKEKRQGRGYARSAGFNTAKYEVLGRIDADSIVEADWVEKMKGYFEQDAELSGATGLARTAFFPGVNTVKNELYSRAYFWFAHAGFNTITMWGANMAIRRSAWQVVADKVLDNDRSLHEDQDLSLWMAAEGDKIVQFSAPIITTEGQSYRYLPKLLRYVRMYQRSLQVHKSNGNFSDSRMNKLGRLHTLPGRLYAVLPAILLALYAVVLFPVDYLVNKYRPDSWWLD